MTEASRGRAFARRLWEARRDGHQVRVEEGERPRGEADAYEVQSGITEMSGREVAGFKIGATAQVAMDLLGVPGPFFGPLYREAFRENGATVRLPMAHSPGIEAEFVVGIESDLPPRDAPWTIGEVRAAVAWVAPGLEVVGTRLEGGLAGTGGARHRGRRRQHRLRPGTDGRGLARRRPRVASRRAANQRGRGGGRQQRDDRVRGSDCGGSLACEPAGNRAPGPACR